MKSTKDDENHSLFYQKYQQQRDQQIGDDHHICTVSEQKVIIFNQVDCVYSRFFDVIAGCL